MAKTKAENVETPTGVADESVNAVAVETQKNIDPMKDKVKLTVTPPSMEQEGETLFVSVNGYTATIKYGEEIEVPRFVAAMLENQKLAIKEARKTAGKLQK